MNTLVGEIKDEVVPEGWGMEGTYSSLKLSNDETLREPQTLLLNGALDRVEVMNYTVDWETRLDRIDVWSTDPDWPNHTYKALPMMGTDPSLGAEITPSWVEGQMDALLVARDPDHLSWFVYADARMEPEYISFMPYAIL